ncbi:MAG: TolC family protein [Burkholderiaceae bacterium]|nr:TolC family protein [Rhodoferax sp.]MCP5286220.1 TolC family protein [Burkholderiaceae bacterium]
MIPRHPCPPASPRHRPVRGALRLAGIAAMVLAALPLAAECRQAEPADPPVVAAGTATAALREIVGRGLDRSRELGAARLLAEAAEADRREAQAQWQPQASLFAGVGPAAGRNGGQGAATLAQGQVGVSLGQLIYDGGYTDALVNWRRRLLEAAQAGERSTQEQLALEVVAASLDRSRYHRQADVYAHYVDSMQCLVDALGQITRADPGRASELVQARKSLRQAELARQVAQNQQRVAESRLARFVGEPLPALVDLGPLFANIPDASQIQIEAERSPSIERLDAERDAAEALARSAQAASRPRVGWTLSASSTAGGLSHSGSLGAALTLNVPLVAPGQDAAEQAARSRALAASLRREDALEQRRSRIGELHLQARQALDIAHRIEAVLGDSQRTRAATLRQWQQLGSRSLFDVMASESEYYTLRAQRVDALVGGQLINATLQSLGRGLAASML